MRAIRVGRQSLYELPGRLKQRHSLGPKSHAGLRVLQEEDRIPLPCATIVAAGACRGNRAICDPGHVTLLTAS